jgi:hypothetical protein
MHPSRSSLLFALAHRILTDTLINSQAARSSGRHFAISTDDHAKRQEPPEEGRVSSLLSGAEQGAEDLRFATKTERRAEEQRVGSFEECSRIESTQGCLRCLFHRLRRGV